VSKGILASKISMGWFHSCALLVDDELKCWGWNDRYQLGIGTTDYQLSPIFVEVDAGVCLRGMCGCLLCR
jgi:alpha-tubulin suppressor-like RCC1 family protein